VCIVLGGVAVLIACASAWIVAGRSAIPLVDLLHGGLVNGGIAEVAQVCAGALILGSIVAVVVDAEAWPLGLVGLLLIGLATPTLLRLIHVARAAVPHAHVGPAVIWLCLGAGLFFLGAVVGFVLSGETSHETCVEGHRVPNGATLCPRCAALRNLDPLEGGEVTKRS
jgi:hypothetical protein